MTAESTTTDTSSGIRIPSHFHIEYETLRLHFLFGEIGEKPFDFAIVNKGTTGSATSRDDHACDAVPYSTVERGGMSDPINTPAIQEGFKRFYALPRDIQEAASTAAVRLPFNISGDEFRYVEFAVADAIADERKRVYAEGMTPSLSIPDVARLSADLTNHLDDHGEWCVGAGGQDTVDRIAKFIAGWTSGEYHRQQAEIARERAELHSGMQWLADRAKR